MVRKYLIINIRRFIIEIILYSILALLGAFIVSKLFSGIIKNFEDVLIGILIGVLFAMTIMEVIAYRKWLRANS